MAADDWDVDGWRHQLEFGIRKHGRRTARCLGSACRQAKSGAANEVVVGSRLMSDSPARITSELQMPAVALVERGVSGRLVVYAGAGISLAEPSGLPTGAEVARRMHGRLLRPYPELASCPDDDLVAVADVVSAKEGGQLAAQSVAAGVAEYLNATPSTGHRVLAHLMLEGLIDVLTTNWDNCIERGSPSERVSAVVTADDLQELLPPSVLKVHGCATRPTSLLLNSAQLAGPPGWVIDETRSRLGNSTVVFVGIGDVARYVQERIEDALATVAEPQNIRIVSPGIVDGWETSQWRSLVPDLPAEHRIAQSADHFLHELAAAFVMRSWLSFQETLEESPVLHQAMESVIAQFGGLAPVAFLSWVRRSALGNRAGVSVVAHPATAEALLALGHRAQNALTLQDDGCVAVDSEAFEVVIVVDALSGSRVRREIQNRSEQRRAAIGPGVDEVSYLVAGVPAWRAVGVLPGDVMGEASLDDVLDGPSAPVPKVLNAAEVIAA